MSVMTDDVPSDGPGLDDAVRCGVVKVWSRVPVYEAGPTEAVWDDAGRVGLLGCRPEAWRKKSRLVAAAAAAAAAVKESDESGSWMPSVKLLRVFLL